MTTLGKLCIRKDYLNVAAGRKTVNSGLVLQARRNPSHNATRFGLTVTKKVGNAVIRNRVKRRLRAIAKEQLPQIGLAGFDYVLIGRKTTITRPFSTLKKDLDSALKYIHKKDVPYAK